MILSQISREGTFMLMGVLVFLSLIHFGTFLAIRKVNDKITKLEERIK